MPARDDPSGESPMARLSTAVDFLGRLDYRNLRMLPNALSILARPSVADWYYNRDLVSTELPRAVRNLLLAPDEMNDFQRHCPVAGYVSTPADGVLAGFTERGRMSTLLAPHTGFTQQLPYYETGGSPLNGARPREGAFFGVERRGDDGVTWLWESTYDHEMRAGPGPGQVTLDYEPLESAPVAATERVRVPPGSETLVRELAVENVGEAPIDRVVYYMQANANERQQYVPGITSPNRVVAGDRRVRWSDRGSDRRLDLVTDADAPVETGLVEGAFDDVFAGPRRTVEGRHVGGYLAIEVGLDPGETTTVAVATSGRADAAGRAALGGSDGTSSTAPTVRADGAPAHDADPATTSPSPTSRGVDAPPTDTRALSRERQAAPTDEWSAWIDALPSVPDRFAPGYERSVVAIAKLCDPRSGSISAAPNFQPVYYPSWPRDSAFIAVALAEAGITGPAKASLASFLPAVQGTDGGFEQCYTSDESSAGVIPRENDQQGIYVHAVRAVAEVTGDDAFVRSAWPAVEAALEYTVDAVADNGLLRATPDFAEMPSHARQSLWTNAFAYRGLLDGAALAAQVGADGERYRRVAARVGDAVERHFFADRDVAATELTIAGAELDDNVAYSAAVHPTGWADDYGYTAALLDWFADLHDDGREYWLPREFTYAAALYADGRETAGDRVLERLRTERLPGGTLAEEVDGDGDHNFAALGWANAAFVHALHVREGVAADVS